jgi:hypothetical protein
MKKFFLSIFAVVSLFSLSACLDDADTVNHNLSKSADNFEVLRNIVFYNTWTDTEVVQVTGYCSISDSGDKLWATCKESDGYKRHSMGRSANLTYFAVQQDNVNVSAYHTRIIWKPQSFIPDIDFKGSTKELLTNQNNNG